ncbi:MAG TPA: translation elongation factor Ts [candidate division WWE3 bacterium]|uniref:Elongation factor Ts n=1 Tax=candidate division WWE3 bacterium TaxID=2053526 RepID=A0A7C1SXM5_UNCKA|nr:translation elongation factor Ts [candidate division WWE3 bacterium]
MAVTTEQIKKLREETQAPVMAIKNALKETGGDEEAAKEILREKALARAEKKQDREATDGMVFSYIHLGGKVGVLLDLRCETDFVARTEDFQKLGRELALQIASMDPERVEDLLEQDYIREPDKKISEVVKEVAGTVGENIKVERFTRYAL